MNRVIFTFIIGYFLTLSITWAEILPDALKSGDLLFVEAQNTGVSGAINRSTQVGTWQFDHVALVEHDSHNFFVLHATTQGGSIRQPLAEFLAQRSPNQQAIQVFRLTSDYQQSITPALERAHALLGKPYNYSYVLNEDSYYCSDFIERAFRSHSIFNHIPMNFKNPATGVIDEIWVERYVKLGKSVPQDEPGSNPNQLAQSEKLEYLGRLQTTPATHYSSQIFSPSS